MDVFALQCAIVDDQLKAGANLEYWVDRFTFPVLALAPAHVQARVA